MLIICFFSYGGQESSWWQSGPCLRCISGHANCSPSIWPLLGLDWTLDRLDPISLYHDLWSFLISLLITLFRLIEYRLRIIKFYCLPKTHKIDISKCPIISAIDSTPSKLVKTITKILTSLLWTISPLQIIYILLNSFLVILASLTANVLKDINLLS